jgi:hypothetical protein
VAQTVVKRVIEPTLEKVFLPDSYGYRPGKSALDAVGITRKRCWPQDWVLEFDIKRLFDNPPPRRPLTAEDVVRRIAAECPFVSANGEVGIRIEPAAALVRQAVPPGAAATAAADAEAPSPTLTLFAAWCSLFAI